MKNIKLYYGYINKFTIDVNLHPDQQIINLEKFIIESEDETVINIYSNSPYVLFHLTLLEGYKNYNIPHPTGIMITNKHFEVKENGDVIEGKYYDTMISDDNLLNDKLGESNDKYVELLELVDKLKRENNG